MIRDVSDRGVYIAGPLAPPFGARLDVDVHLPRFEAGARSVELQGEGIVVRVDRDSDGVNGFAATVAFRTEAADEPSPVNPRRVN
jgi:hypothetical protein